MTCRPGLDVEFHQARGSQVEIEERHRPSQDCPPVWALRLLRGAKRVAIIVPRQGFIARSAGETTQHKLNFVLLLE